MWGVFLFLVLMMNAIMNWVHHSGFSKKMFKKCTLFLMIHCALVFFSPAYAAEKNQKNKFIAIIVDDLGSSIARGEQLIQIPAQLTYSFLPYSPYTVILASEVHRQGKEVMLHLPMEPLVLMDQKDMGVGGLMLNMKRQQFVSAVRSAVLAVPFAVGVNNHMGSLLTGSTKNMRWLMGELKQLGGFYFVDSRTHKSTVAVQAATRQHLPNAARDIFLDHVVEKNAIDRQFRRLIRRAHLIGHGLAIGHPHTLTIQALTHWVTKIKAEGIELVPVSEYIRLLERSDGNAEIWQVSLPIDSGG